jgi:hypothetical protein
MFAYFLLGLVEALWSFDVVYDSQWYLTYVSHVKHCNIKGVPCPNMGFLRRQAACQGVVWGVIQGSTLPSLGEQPVTNGFEATHKTGRRAVSSM